MTGEPNYSPTHELYWAAEPPEKIASAVLHRFRRYQERLLSEGRWEVWKTADRCYHGRNPDGGYSNSTTITFGGEQGEVSQLHVGHFRRHIGGQLALATSQRPAIEVTANSNNPEAIAATQVGKQIIDYDLDEGVEQSLIDTHERALLYSEGYLIQTWDAHKGELVGTQQLGPEYVDVGAPGLTEDADVAAEQGIDMVVREGAVRVDVRSPIDVARDLDTDRVDEQPWYIVRTRVHRWELAARFPEDSEKRRAIYEAPDADSDDYTLWERERYGDGESDYIHQFTLYHLPTDALPQGRIVEVVGEEWLFDEGYPYDHCVVHRDVPAAEMDHCVGYSSGWDLLALSQALDSVESGMLSISDAGSLQNWLAARGQKVDSKMLEGGFNVIEYDDDGTGKRPPGLMDRPEVRETDFKMSEHYQGHMRTLSGQNAVVQGDPDANIKSGNFAALVASMAVQAINREAGAYGALMRSVMVARIKLYQAFAKTERLIEMTGRDKLGHVMSFTGEKLKGVRGVKVELANPILRTLQGKAEIADKLLERYGPQQITLPDYFSLLQTGRMDDIDKSSVIKHKVIARRENDMFREGQTTVIALITDHHACHISEHLEQLNDASVRLDPNSVEQLKALGDHITQHAMLWPQLPPALAAATGQEMVPASMGGGGAPPQQGGPPPPGPGGGGEPVMPGPEAAMGAPAGPPGAGGSQPGMPGLPANPLTGESAGVGIG